MERTMQLEIVNKTFPQKDKRLEMGKEKWIFNIQSVRWIYHQKFRKQIFSERCENLRI